jgi:hypothetical protein
MTPYTSLLLRSELELRAALDAHAEWERKFALRFSMSEWADRFRRQTDMYAALQRTLGADDALMARVHRRGRWYLIPDAALYPTLQAYMDATLAELAADVRSHQGEVAFAERVQPARASKRARVGA